MKDLAFNIFRKITYIIPYRIIARVPVFMFLYKAMYRKLKPSGVILKKVQGNMMYIDTKDSSVSMDILMRGYYAKTETKLLKRLIKKGMTVVDIGANIGYYTLLFSRLVGQEGRVYAFEPEPYNYSLLERSIKQNGYKNIHLIQKALSDESGSKINLFLNKKNFGSGSFSSNNVRGETDVVVVETAMLDDYLAGKTVDLIKMDVQGGENRVIKGAKKTLEFNNKIVIVTEFWPYGLENVGTLSEEFLLDLLSQGFSVRDIDGETNITSRDDILYLISSCKNIKNGWGSVNLLIKKTK